MLFLLLLLSAGSAHSTVMLQQTPPVPAVVPTVVPAGTAIVPPVKSAGADPAGAAKTTAPAPHSEEAAKVEMDKYAKNTSIVADLAAVTANAHAELGEAEGTGFSTSNITDWANDSRGGLITDLGDNFSSSNISADFEALTKTDLDNVKDSLELAYNLSKSSGTAGNLSGKYLEAQKEQGGLETKAPMGDDITGTTDVKATKTWTHDETYDKEKSKKGTGSRANLEQNLKTESQADVNTTRTFTKNNQTDTRLNKTGRYETPRLFTNRTGYGKVAWRGTDKLALWEMANAVDTILMGATKIDKMTGSVGRVGETTEKPSFGAPQVNYRSAVGPAVSAGDR